MTDLCFPIFALTAIWKLTIPGSEMVAANRVPARVPLLTIGARFGNSVYNVYMDAAVLGDRLPASIFAICDCNAHRGPQKSLAISETLLCGLYKG